MSNLSNLIELARSARTQIEQLNRQVHFNHYISILPDNLAGGCGVASLHILNMANKKGMRPTFVAGTFEPPNKWADGHCWVEYCGHIIDITATQFINCEPVHISTLKKASEYKGDFRSKKLKEAELRILTWANYVPELRSLA